MWTKETLEADTPVEEWHFSKDVGHRPQGLSISTQSSTLSVLTSKSAGPKICFHLTIYFLSII